MEYTFLNHLPPPNSLTPLISTRLDILLYFYSTLPQVLGAVLALTGAFAVFRLDSMKRELGARVQKVIEIMNIDTSRPLLREGLTDKVTSEYYQDFRIHQLTLDRNVLSKITAKFKKALSDAIMKLPLEEKRSKEKTAKHDLYFNLWHFTSIVESQVKHIKLFLNRTTWILIVGGFSIILMISAFLIIPNKVFNMNSYWWLLISGLVIFALTLMLIILYIIISLKEKRILTLKDYKLSWELSKFRNRLFKLKVWFIKSFRKKAKRKK